MKTYGPYVRKDGRRHVIHDVDGVRTTQSYPRYLMEQYLGRKLLPSEHVDHVNDDPTDDRIENYQILTPKENNIKAVINSGRSAKTMTVICGCCGKTFEVFTRRFNHNQIMQNKKGPYCSKSCAGKIHH